MLGDEQVCELKEYCVDADPLSLLSESNKAGLSNNESNNDEEDDDFGPILNYGQQDLCWRKLL